MGFLCGALGARKRSSKVGHTAISEQAQSDKNMCCINMPPKKEHRLKLYDICGTVDV